MRNAATAFERAAQWHYYCIPYLKQANKHMAFWSDPLIASGKRRGSRNNIDRRTYLIDAHQYAKRGEALPQARLTADKVRKIRMDAKAGVTAKSQAAEYGVHIRTIEAVRSYKTWALV